MIGHHAQGPLPDVYTHLGIYKQNEWGLKPSIYSDAGPDACDTLRDT